MPRGLLSASCERAARMRTTAVGAGRAINALPFRVVRPDGLHRSLMPTLAADTLHLSPQRFHLGRGSVFFARRRESSSAVRARAWFSRMRLLENGYRSNRAAGHGLHAMRCRLTAGGRPSMMAPAGLLDSGRCDAYAGAARYAGCLRRVAARCARHGRARRCALDRDRDRSARRADAWADPEGGQRGPGLAARARPQAPRHLIRCAPVVDAAENRRRAGRRGGPPRSAPRADRHRRAARMARDSLAARGAREDRFRAAPSGCATRVPRARACRPRRGL